MKQNIIQSTRNFNADNVNYSLLKGDFGKQILKEYNQLVQDEYRNASALNVLSFSDDVVKGSNPFAFILLNRVLQDRGKWVARPADLERALEKRVIKLDGTYGDSSLVLRSESDPNEYLAKNLASQVKTKGYDVGGDALMILLAGLGLIPDSNSPYDLSFQLTDSSKIILAPQFNKTNHEKEFNRTDEQGLPVFKDRGSRILYSREEGGICRLCRYWNRDLGAGGTDLVNSNFNGLVIVCSEGRLK